MGFYPTRNTYNIPFHDLPYTNQAYSCLTTFAFIVPSNIHVARSHSCLGLDFCFVFVQKLCSACDHTWPLYLKLHLRLTDGTLSFFHCIHSTVHITTWHILDIFIYSLTFFLFLTKTNSMNSGITVCFFTAVSLVSRKILDNI